MAEKVEMEDMSWANSMDEGKTYTCNVDNPEECLECGS